MRRGTRAIFSAVAAFAVIGASSSAAFAHSEISPASTPAGAETALTLKLENERSSASTVKVEMFFPDGQEIVVTKVPDVGEWSGAPQGGPGGGPGALGDPAPGITWQRASGTPSDNPSLTFSLVLPDRAGTIQMAVLQTYSDGTVDRWIDPWPAGQPEPESPGPRLTLTAVQASTSTSQGSTTSAPTSTTGDTSTSSTRMTSGGFIAGMIAILFVIGAIFMIVRARRQS
ncbi:MAG: DUF1775 domain-containing protein [Actinomycetes bacterium]